MSRFSEDGITLARFEDEEWMLQADQLEHSSQLKSFAS
jgi:hypothetical protein